MRAGYDGELGMPDGELPGTGCDGELGVMESY